MSAVAGLLLSLTANVGRVTSHKLIPEFLLVLSALVSVTMANEYANALTKANNAFTNKLYTELAKKEGNVFFSPISVHTILSLVHQGAEGDTESVLRTGLGIPGKSLSADGFSTIMAMLNNVGNVTLNMANKVYTMENYNLKESFKTVAEESFFSEAENIDFRKNTEAAKSINKWVEDKTNNKIHNLIDPSALDSLTRLVLVNAIYFKGNWLDQFDAKATTDEPFYINEKDFVTCKMMHATRKYNYAEIEELDAQVLRLPYMNKDISLIIVLPKKRDGIAALEEKLRTYDLSSLSGKLYNVEVVTSIPKFKIETEMELKDPLTELGLGNIFSDDADFSGLLDSKESLQVSKVIQKAFIEVNEEGAEAAAATGAIMMLRCMPMVLPKKEFNADHPFIFFVMHTGNNLFHGKLCSL